MDKRVFDADSGNHLLRIQILGEDSHRSPRDDPEWVLFTDVWVAENSTRGEFTLL